MITIFTIPKPFEGHISVIQRNAILSWLQLKPSCEVILFGNDEGTSKIASELGVKYVPDIARNEYGTPLLNDIFEKAQQMASNDIICYVNADIILMSDFLKAVERVKSKKKKYLIVGQRWNVDIDNIINFDSEWENNIHEIVNEKGIPYGTYGMDYFVFPCGQYRNFPPFAVGRPAWDNWMIYDAHKRKIPVIDATKVVLCVHQNHDYSHLKNINNRFGDGPEANNNMILAGLSNGDKHVYELLDSNYILTKNFMIIPIKYKCILIYRNIYKYYSKIYRKFKGN